ncbi:MAG: tetratricopeptide repeat protein [Desulfobacteraceae bacterium]|nr:tetratricopeptide repeat protein [Desulfobacteraceae bacterium]
MSRGGPKSARRDGFPAKDAGLGRVDALIAGAILLVAGAGYWPTLGFGLVSDDLSLFGGNYQLQSLRYLPSFFTGGVWDAVLHGKVDGALYRPLFLVYVTVLNLLCRGRAEWLHASSVLLHAMNSALVFFVLRRWLTGGKRLAAALGAALFALHPAHAGSVAWVSASPDLLAGFLLLVSLLFYDRAGAGRALPVVIAFLVFVAALFVKETAIVFPLALAGGDWLAGRFSGRRLALFLSGSVFYYLCRLAALAGQTEQGLSLAHLDMGKLWYLARFIPAYAKQLLWPTGQPFFLFAPVDHYLAGLRLVAWGGLFLALWALAWRLKPRRALLAGGWILLFLAPALALAFCNQPIFEVRYLYLPSLGFVLLITLLMAGLEDRVGAGWLLLLTIPILLAAGYVGGRESKFFRDGAALCERIIRSAPTSSKGYLCLAAEREGSGDPGRALELLNQALALAASPEERVESNYDLGLFLAKGRDPLAGLPYLREAVRLDPAHSAANNAIGNICLIARRPGEAIGYYQRALESRRDNFEALFNLGQAYELTGALPQALDSYRKFVAQAPRELYPRQFALAQGFIRRAAGR